ncbi:SWR1-complex protein 4 [Boeremia exigua]|uniref:SWR1-complex protein 4 n=1 Tax=Boeremia exigua TaxID=749465 RepID=UPI001E8DF617|nr:SWR1-complex protein 4 [Boeremia exigua]KAH6639369.1 SWR1-complex protein 4 [Boeremia exigua]
MASNRDVRDMLGLPVGEVAPPTANKKSKKGGQTKRIQGVAREVAALYGERPPPVAVYEEKKAYRAKRQSTGPAKKWIQQPFINPARNDGLVLKHWRRKPTNAPPAHEGDDAAMQDSDPTDYIENCADFVKYNITVDMPDFTDEDYDAHLRSDDWSREETDYLFGIVKDYSYRWAVIWDRYEWQAIKRRERELAQAAQENGDADVNALATLPFAPPRDKERSLEDMKARFYDISAKLMKLRISEVQMDADQYSLYETLSKFDPNMEKNRKMLATALMNRSMDEVREEEYLLTELQRINMAAVRLDAEREELRSRLDAPQANTSSAAGLQSFTSSTALQALFQQLFQQDRSKKRSSGGTNAPGRLSLSANDMINTPSASNSANRRTSMALPPVAPSQTPVKTLSPHQEHRFAVSTHDRLTSGVTFGSDKLLKMRQAKSNVQTQKIASALQELGVPEIIPIPTSKVADIFEQLVSKVGRLLDVRKVKEKEMGECRVLSRMKAARDGTAGNAGVKQEGEGSAETSGEDAKKDNQDTPMGDSNEDNMGDSNDDDDDDDDDAEGEDDTGAQNTPANADRDDVGADEDDDEDDDDAEGEDDTGALNTPANADRDDVDAEGEDESAAQTSRATSQGAGHKRSASELSEGSQPSEKRARK